MARRKYLTINEMNDILSATSSGMHALRDSCLFRICFYHGLRVSEACRLTLADVDLHHEIIYINRLKNGFSTTHPLTHNEVKELKSWLEIRRLYREADEPWLFPSQKGGHLSRQQVYSLLRKYGHIAGLTIKPHPHMLRHGCGYALADRGIDTRLIQDYLGHRNIRHTVLYTASNAGRFRNIWHEEFN